MSPPALRTSPSARQRVEALTRMSFAEQLAALERREYTVAEWRSARTEGERLKLLCSLSAEAQFDALRLCCFTLGEWCAFARQHPQRVFKLGGKFAFIAITTPEWCEQ